LSEFDKYIEIKGYMADYANQKINRFRKIYPKIKFEILMQKELTNMGILI